jgi:hypothetical protein
MQNKNIVSGRDGDVLLTIDSVVGDTDILPCIEVPKRLASPRINCAKARIVSKR